ncbi:hypothetical protein AB1Y20_009963 [Prymnesium parvum]|uniref:Uncharacterized protein n=1 Tax=Prymnesium parvum TaxID=97485 RepID=A0AB34K7H4_PRYPA
MQNLVGCAEQIREYEKERERLDAVAKHKVMERREQAKRKAEEEAAAAAAEGLGADREGEDVAPAMPAHRQKKHPLWECFDLQQEKPSCKLLNPAGGVYRGSPSMVFPLP